MISFLMEVFSVKNSLKLYSSFMKKGVVLSILALTFFFTDLALAGDGGAQGIGTLATNITGSFRALGMLILAIAFLAGIGFVMAAIFKFKQHKDNPTQIPLGTPVAMLVIGIVLIFLPNLILPAGTTIFGGSAQTGGWTGKVPSGTIPGAS
jgi:intracellular multiplication protein IcmD